MNVADIVVIMILCCAVGGAVRILYRNKKAGKTSCGGDCAHCMQGCRDKSLSRKTEIR